jgi:lysophospholipase L1-like esterase
MLTLLDRLVRASGLAMVLVLAGTAIVLGRDWFKAIRPHNDYSQRLTIAFLEMLLAGYFVVLAAVAVAVVVLGSIVWRSRSRSRTARWLLLCGSIVLGLVTAEAAAAVWLSWIHRLPPLPHQFAGPAQPGDEIRIVVIGESSALGVPYDGWLSVGTIVGRELQKAMPARHFQVEILAEKGATLEAMHLKLAHLTRRPDVLIVFSGHNEFLARFSLSSRVAYYSDDERSRTGQTWPEFAGRFSPLYRLIRENLEKHRVSMIAVQSLGALETIVGRPVCTSNEANAVVVDFHRRLEAIVTDCERIGCLPILIIPPGNDASSPNQSYADPATRAPTRHALARRLMDVLSIEERDPDRAIAIYQEIVAKQPTLARAHHRLARLLQSAPSFVEANRHYILARDHDGLPLRCITPLEAAYQSVARRHAQSIVLVDGPTVLRTKSRHGILDTELFHDNVHPTLAGHTALAEAVLRSLKARAAFGWPASTPVPVLNPQRCAVEFGMDAFAWATVCDRSAAYYGQLALLPSDSAERVEWRDRYANAARRIRAGARPEDVGILDLRSTP